MSALHQALRSLADEVERNAGNNNADHHREWANRIRIAALLSSHPDPSATVEALRREVETRRQDYATLTDLWQADYQKLQAAESKLARVEALADEWDNGRTIGPTYSEQLRAALKDTTP